MVKDSNTSPWIYVVKSGSVQVLKRLARAEPTMNRNTGRAKAQRRASPDEAFKAFMANELDDYLLKNRLALPPPITCHTNGPIGGASLQRHSSRLAASAATSSGEWRGLASAEQAPTRSLSAPSGPRSPEARQTSAQRAGGRDEEVPLTVTTRHSDGFPNRSSDSAAGDGKQRRRTFIDDLDGGVRSGTESRGADAEASPVFVRVQTLTKGSVFGLSHMILMDQPSFCLVSNGADCMLINRSFYREHCPQSLLRYLLRSLSPYATDEEMQANLLKKLNWDALRHATIVQTMK